MKNFDCLVLPSYREGMSNVLLHAGLNSLPSICTDVPGCREIIKNNFNGFICNEKNYKDLYSKMEKNMELNIIIGDMKI